MQSEGFVAAAQAMAAAGDFLLVQGEIAADGASAAIGEILTLPTGAQPLPEPGAYSLELRGSGGSLLASHSFTPTVYADEGTGTAGLGLVNLLIPTAPGTQTIEIRLPQRQRPCARGHPPGPQWRREHRSQRRHHILADGGPGQ